MTDYLPENDKPFNDLSVILSAIAYTLKSKGKVKVALLLSKANISLEYIAHDNWNGGTAVWQLCVKTPFQNYIEYTDVERRDLELLIDDVIKSFISDSAYFVSSKFKPLHVADPNWRENINVTEVTKSTNNSSNESDFDSFEKCLKLLTTCATEGGVSNDEYIKLRGDLLGYQNIAHLFPSWLMSCRNLELFWGFIKQHFATYKERRFFIAAEFTEALNALEFGQTVNVKEHRWQTDSSFIVNSPKAKSKIFIVHGHDNEAKQEVARHIESLGIEAIILHEKASSGMTIIEKIEHYAGEADFALILYTACDKGRGATETNVLARNRARQNVVFEHGYLMAKLGRKNVCALVKGVIETPNDISGVVYVSLDAVGAWKADVNKELKSCGYELA
jgi:predicted nucleotide-binding protein